MSSDILDSVERVCREVTAPDADGVDREGRFPHASIEALAEAGVLGVLSTPEAGGRGGTLGEAASVVRRLARECGSTAMITCMHLSGAVVIEAYGTLEQRRSVAAGALTTLAFSERGSRSHFWAPMSSARIDGDLTRLDAQKSWVTAANEAETFVWSSRPAEADGMSTLWLVPSGVEGLKIDGGFDGLGLRGNDSCPIAAAGVGVPMTSRLGDDGSGFDIMMGVVLPTFSVLNAATSIGMAEAALAGAARHLSSTKLEHLASTLADDPVNRSRLGAAVVRCEEAAALLASTISALDSAAPEAQLRVLEVKASAGEAALEVTDECMRLCGGSAFRREVGVERRFRDSRAAAVMAPTTDVLHDFIAKATLGQPLF